MGLISGNTNEFKVYLTDYGKQKMLEQDFVPASFSLGDSGTNYLSNNSITKKVVNITGDFDDEVYSISKHIKKIRNKIIK